MEHFEISIFGNLDSQAAFDEIIFDLQDEMEPTDRAIAFEERLKQGAGEISFKRTSKMGSPFGEVKVHLRNANLGWKEMTTNEEGSIIHAVIASPGDHEEITIDLVYGEPAIELYVLLKVRAEGMDALDKLITDVEKASKYGDDLILTLSDGLVSRYITECAANSPTP